MNSIAILLAAGDSQRMGSPKALLSWHGRPLLSHQVRQIEASRVTECVVVLGRDAERMSPHLTTSRFSPPERFRTVINPYPDSGRCASIIEALGSILDDPDGLFIISVDQPVEKKLLDAMLDAAATEWKEAGARPRRTIVVPSHAGRRGHPPLFHGSMMTELGGIVEESHGLKAVVRRRAERVLEMPWANSDILLNLNRPGDVPPAPGRGSPAG